YWLKRLPTFPVGPSLPLAKSPASVHRPVFVRRTSRLDSLTWGRLKARGGQVGLTPSIILCAAYAEVLAAWSKTPHFCLNLPIFNRLPVHPQAQDIVGEFTSILLLEVDYSGRDCFEVRARRIQDQLWNDFNHRSFSGVKVLREMALLRSQHVTMP